jgi:PAS domain S-box-containing protein
MDSMIISKEKLHQAKSRIHNYQVSPITEIIMNGFFTVNQKWIVTHWNKASEDLSGLGAKDILGKNLWKQFPEAISSNFFTACHKAFREEKPLHFEQYCARRKTWFDLIAYHINNSLSISFKRIVHNEQLSANLYVDQQLGKLTNFYRLVTEVTNDALWEWDLIEGEIYWIDGGHKRAFGYEIENSLVPQCFWESRLHPDDKSRVISKLKRIMNQPARSIWEDEYRFKKADSNYAYVHDRGHIIYEKGKATRMIGATQDITSRKITEIELMQQKLIKYREITDAVRTAQERERSEIGKELHENVNQILSAARLYIGIAKTEKTNKNKYLEKSSTFLLNGIEEIRRICKILAPIGIYHIGLVESINDLINNLKEEKSLQIKFDDAGIDLKDLDLKLKLTIFRIVQEQLNNIVKHSKATKAIIHLSREQNEIILSISDNGRGCNILKAKEGVGIININSRADFYHGSVVVNSEQGGGFVLKVVLPFNTIV